MNKNYDYLINLCDKAYPGTIIQKEICDFLKTEKYNGSNKIADIKKFIEDKKKAEDE